MNESDEQPDLFALDVETSPGAATVSTRADQRRAVEAELLRVKGEKSDRQIATATGASHPFAAKVRREMEARGELQPVSTRTDSAGRQQPAKKLRPSRQAREPDPVIPALVETDVEVPDPQPAAAGEFRESTALLGLPQLIAARLDLVDDVETALRGIDARGKKDLGEALRRSIGRLQAVESEIAAAVAEIEPRPEIAWAGSDYAGYVATTKGGTFYVVITPGQCPAGLYTLSQHLVAKLSLAKLEAHNRARNPRGRQGYRDWFDHRDALANPRRRRCQQLFLNGCERELGEVETLAQAKKLVAADYRAQSRR